MATRYALSPDPTTPASSPEPQIRRRPRLDLVGDAEHRLEHTTKRLVDAADGEAS